MSEKKYIVIKEWDCENPPRPVGARVLYRGILHEVVDAGEQGTRLAAVKDDIRAAAEKLNTDIFSMEKTRWFLEKHGADIDAVNAERIDLIEQAIRDAVDGVLTSVEKEMSVLGKMNAHYELFYRSLEDCIDRIRKGD